jgi:hypothetical protein
MKATLRWILSVGVGLASGLTGLGQAAAAVSPETSPAITIHVHNYAGVAPKTLAEAEEVATGIFRKAGVETRWADIGLTSENCDINFTDHPAFTLADLQLSIFSRIMSDESGVRESVMGLAPGNGPDRNVVYIFDSNVEARYRRLLMAHFNGIMDWHVSKSQILGHAIAHELGHLLLNQQVHSAHGIMRGEWSLEDFRDVAYGKFLFTPPQAEFLRADARKRNSQQEALKVDELESPTLAH